MDVKTIDVRFRYKDKWRQVSNVTFEKETGTLIGFEMRTNGEFSYKPKRYTLGKIEDLTFVKPFLREGPKIGLPDTVQLT
jgi:hypothetical protein